MGIATVELTVARAARAGRFVIDLTAALLQRQVGSPVIVQQASGPVSGRGVIGDDAEFDMISCAAEVLSVKQLRVRWTTRGLVRGKRKFHYLIAA